MNQDNLANEIKINVKIIIITIAIIRNEKAKLMKMIKEKNVIGSATTVEGTICLKFRPKKAIKVIIKLIREILPAIGPCLPEI